MRLSKEICNISLQKQCGEMKIVRAHSPQKKRADKPVNRSPELIISIRTQDDLMLCSFSVPINFVFLFLFQISEPVIYVKIYIMILGTIDIPVDFIRRRHGLIQPLP